MAPEIPKGVILTASGTRGIVGEPDGLTPAFLVPLAMAYGTWLRQMTGGTTPSVLLGRDTRPSGYMIESGMVHALLATGCNVHVAGICPTPAVIHAKRHLGLDGGIIISASHNPAEYNGLKFLSPQPPGTFLSNEEIDDIKTIFFESRFHVASWQEPAEAGNVDIIPPYLKMIEEFAMSLLRGTCPFNIIVDSGAGAAKVVTVPLLERLGCNVTSINEHLSEKPPFFPRNSEPIEENLGKLTEMVQSQGADIGLGIDCDADRISLCDEDGKIRREDEGLALIMKNLPELYRDYRKLVIVTNVASSLMFDDIAREKGGYVLRTPIGERYLAIQMHELDQDPVEKDRIAVIGGEGSCGGVMIPELNLARDATLAAACVIAIMARRELPLSELLNELPKYHLEKIKVEVTGRDPLQLIESMASLHDVSSFERVMNDIKFSGEGWWVLIHPSNTEPVIRILAESRNAGDATSLLRQYQDELQSLLDAA
ncbi:MAG TPA: hypothetical protein VKM55_17110 [Candidatus Lokiarchaeia archaeon]|nr:hypothetical protein [Candidatus Lokiarchaeia archaeon]